MTNHLRLVSGDGAAPTGVRLDDSLGLVSHKDIGHIAVTDIDGITINRTKTGLSPFTPILKTPTYSRNSGTHSGYAVEIEDPTATTGHRHVGNVSASYLLLSNEEVRDLAVEIAFQSGIPFKESRIFWDGARSAHVIDFTESEEVAPGDAVGLSLITRSSYDKSWRYETALMGKRFLCDNGALSGEFFARVSFKHVTTAGDPKEATWRDIVRQGMSVIDRAPDDLHSFARSLRAMKGARMTDGRLREIWQALPGLGDGVKGQIMSQYVEHEEPSVYGLFNAGTAVFSHRQKMTGADFSNNDEFTTALLRFAAERLN